MINRSYTMLRDAKNLLFNGQAFLESEEYKTLRSSANEPAELDLLEDFSREDPNNKTYDAFKSFVIRALEIPEDEFDILSNNWKQEYLGSPGTELLQRNIGVLLTPVGQPIHDNSPVPEGELPVVKVSVPTSEDVITNITKSDANSPNQYRIDVYRSRISYSAKTNTVHLPGKIKDTYKLEYVDGNFKFELEKTVASNDMLKKITSPVLPEQGQIETWVNLVDAEDEELEALHSLIKEFPYHNPSLSIFTTNLFNNVRMLNLEIIKLNAAIFKATKTNKIPLQGHLEKILNLKLVYLNIITSLRLYLISPQEFRHILLQDMASLNGETINFSEDKPFIESAKAISVELAAVLLNLETKSDENEKEFFLSPANLEKFKSNTKERKNAHVQTFYFSDIEVENYQSTLLASLKANPTDTDYFDFALAVAMDELFIMNNKGALVVRDQFSQASEPIDPDYSRLLLSDYLDKYFPDTATGIKQRLAAYGGFSNPENLHEQVHDKLSTIINKNTKPELAIAIETHFHYQRNFMLATTQLGNTIEDARSEIKDSKNKLSYLDNNDLAVLNAAQDVLQSVSSKKAKELSYPEKIRLLDNMKTAIDHRKAFLSTNFIESINEIEKIGTKTNRYIDLKRSIGNVLRMIGLSITAASFALIPIAAPTGFGLLACAAGIGLGLILNAVGTTLSIGQAKTPGENMRFFQSAMNTVTSVRNVRLAYLGPAFMKALHDTVLVPFSKKAPSNEGELSFKDFTRTDSITIGGKNFTQYKETLSGTDAPVTKAETIVAIKKFIGTELSVDDVAATNFINNYNNQSLTAPMVTAIQVFLSSCMEIDMGYTFSADKMSELKVDKSGQFYFESTLYNLAVKFPNGVENDNLIFNLPGSITCRCYIGLDGTAVLQNVSINSPAIEKLLQHPKDIVSHPERYKEKDIFDMESNLVISIIKESNAKDNLVVLIDHLKQKFQPCKPRSDEEFAHRRVSDEYRAIVGLIKLILDNPTNLTYLDKLERSEKSLAAFKNGSEDEQSKADISRSIELLTSFLKAYKSSLSEQPSLSSRR